MPTKTKTDTTTEYGLFSDEGLIEGNFYSVAAAETANRERYNAEDELTIEAVCHDHPEQAHEWCEDCNAE